MYPAAGYPALPLCANDVQAIKKALIAGLNVSESNIMVCGHHGTATTKDLITGLYSSISGTANEDTFIFYFSGHGRKNVLALSDGDLNLQSLIDVIEKIPAKNKIIILDSCHSGYFANKRYTCLRFIRKYRDICWTRLCCSCFMQCGTNIWI